MRRILAALQCDIRLQWRNGFYAASLFVALSLILILRQLPVQQLTKVLPVCFLSNLFIGTFYFIAGLVLLEKKEGTLAAQVVTPLRAWEYLLSKILSLLLLASLENLLILEAAALSARALPFLLGLASGTAVLVLGGFIAVSRFRSVNEYLFPSFLITLLFVPPFLNYLGLFRNSLNSLHPLNPALMLMSLAFGQGGEGEGFYLLAGSLVWLAIAFLGALRAFDRFVVGWEGGGL